MEVWPKQAVADAQLAVARVKVQLQEADSYKDTASRAGSSELYVLATGFRGVPLDDVDDEDDE